MSRHAPRYQADDIVAKVVLDPNGAHRVEVETTGGIMIAVYDRNTIPKVEQAFAQFRSLTVQADGGPDFYNPKTIALEVSR